MFEKKYDETADKFSHLMKEKMLIKLERDRLKTRAQIQREMNATNNIPLSETKDRMNETENNQNKTLNKTK